LMFGGLVPDHWTSKIAVHFTHRVGALVVALGALATSLHVFYHHGRRRELRRPAVLLLALVAVQITLGALTGLSRRDVTINSLHVVCGALVLTTSLVLTLRSWRVKFAVESDSSRRRPTAVADFRARLQPQAQVAHRLSDLGVDADSARTKGA